MPNISTGNKKYPTKYTFSFKDVLVKLFLPAIAALLLHELILYISTLDIQYSIFKTADFVRWDSALYIHIANNGYELMPCHEVFSSYPKTSTEWCGNAGWMPLYPYLIKLLMLTGIHEYSAGFGISKFCLFGVYICVAFLLNGKDKSTRVLTFILAAVFPATVYYDAVFPVSLLMLLLLGAYCLWDAGFYKSAYALAFLAPLAYSTGFLNAAIWAGLSIALHKRKSPDYPYALKMFIAASTGFISFIILQWISVGRWNAFFLIQGKYGHGFHNIFADLWNMIVSVFKSGINHNWQNIQTLVFIAFLIGFARFRLKSDDIRELFLRLSFIVFAAFPLIIGSSNLSQFRAESLLLPLVLLIGERKILAISMIPVFTYLFIECAIEFFHGTIT